jgi:quercetin dioxygenase-like cupin family protein
MRGRLPRARCFSDEPAKNVHRKTESACGACVGDGRRYRAPLSRRGRFCQSDRTLTVTEGQGLSEHTAPFDALVYVLEGSAEITVGSKLLQTKSGEAVLLPANQPHAVKAHTRFKMLLTMIRS